MRRLLSSSESSACRRSSVDTGRPECGPAFLSRARRRAPFSAGLWTGAERAAARLPQQRKGGGGARSIDSHRVGQQRRITGNAKKCGRTRRERCHPESRSRRVFRLIGLLTLPPGFASSFHCCVAFSSAGRLIRFYYQNIELAICIFDRSAPD